MEKYVLVFTGKEDPLWPFLLEECSTEEKKRFLLFATDSPNDCRLNIDPIKKIVKIATTDTELTNDNISGILWRRLVSPDLTNLNMSNAMINYIDLEYQAFFEELEYVLNDIVWVSKPSKIINARHKGLQLALANEVGFKTVDTIFTNWPHEALNFYINDKTIFKSIRSPRIPIKDNKHSTIFTTLLKKQDLEMINGIKSCPGIFQRFIEKTKDIRVSVFSNNVFAVEISSQEQVYSKVDFRRGAKNLKHDIHMLPKDIVEKCLLITKKLGLNFGAIDLVLNKDNEYIFLEINPNGQWGWLEEITKLPMRRNLINILFNKENV